MKYRSVTRNDIAACLQIQPACIGDEIVGREKAGRIWLDLLHSCAFSGSVVESKTLVAGSRILACGLGVFVCHGFANDEIANPRPGLNSRILASIAAGRSVLLSHDEIAHGNAGSGLDFVNMYGSWRAGILNAEQLSEVKALLGTSWIEQHAGYRINRVLKEAIGHECLTLAKEAGFWKTVRIFPELQRALVMFDRQSAASVPYSLAGLIYQYKQPVLALGEADKQLLAAALGGATDIELAEKLRITVTAVKRRWFRIFRRVEDRLPDLLTSSWAQESEAGRGRQKRHHLLTYIRAHREELRPFAAKQKSQPRSARERVGVPQKPTAKRRSHGLADARRDRQ